MREQLYRWFLPGLLLVSCARTELKPQPAQPSPGADGGGGTGLISSGTPGEPAATACSFPQTPASFTLPAFPGLPPGSLTSISGEAACIGGRAFRYALLDMDGDLQPDLVVETGCADTSIGVDAWNVYTNTGAGFAEPPKRFALPSPRLDPSCAKTTLADVDGDLKPDLVVTSLCTDATVGTTRWLVYLNGAAGFGAQQAFALPAGFGAGAFASIGPETAACAAGRPGYAFFDLDGDRKSDLVVTTACDNPQIGTTAWRVYLGSGASVAAVPMIFPLPLTPTVPVGTYASAASGGAGCTAKPPMPVHSLVDVDGDFKPDLVLTQDCTDTAVGSTRWSLFRNDGTGFAATAATLALPVVPGVSSVGAFATLDAQPVCSGGQQRLGFTTLDVNGNLRPDLLVTRACNDFLTGVSRWLLFRDEDGGFASTAEALSLPSSLGGTVAAPLSLAGDASCTASPVRPGFVAAYLARSKLDLVVTKVCGDSTVGTSRWLVYQASCP
jgi:hypothetical protein